MRHRHGYRKLGRESSHRKAMLRNMATSFMIQGKINTTLPKAKELRSIVERMITLGKRGDLHARRLAASYLFDDRAVKRVFDELGPAFKDRPGGYTRILRTGVRFGDGATLARLELVDTPAAGESAPKKKAKAETAKAKETAPATKKKAAAAKPKAEGAAKKKTKAKA